MKIGYNAKFLFGRSGIETYSREIIKGVLEQFSDIEINLITSFNRKDNIVDYFGNKPNMNVLNVLPHDLIIGNIGRPLVRKYDELIYKKKAKDLDLIHFTHSFGFPKIENSITTIHDLFPLYYDCGVDKDYFKKCIDDTLSSSRAVIVPTQNVKEDILKYYDYDESRINVIYEAANPVFRMKETNYDLSKKFNLPESDFFLYVGRYEERKNIERIVSAYSKLRSDIREKHKLVLVANGRDEDLVGLSNHIANNDSKNIYHLTGLDIDDLIQFYNNCKVFVFPSFFEGFGLPIIEAMQCGAPVITSTTSCLPEVAGDAAVLVDPYSTEELHSAMEKIVSDDSLHSELKLASINRAKKFSWANAAKETVRVYKKYSK
ncbi:MAG: glycosyltransferase family 1 protein [Candidatus Kapaibacterium sp.]|nr:glycosyltransferase family 4 protein [Ignavibacteriota bacterium]MCB9221129.1 glycosyltransferase family 4 protein [Ignavibacteria bacterium]